MNTCYYRNHFYLRLSGSLCFVDQMARLDHDETEDERALWRKLSVCQSGEQAWPWAAFLCSVSSLPSSSSLCSTWIVTCVNEAGKSEQILSSIDWCNQSGPLNLISPDGKAATVAFYVKAWCRTQVDTNTHIHHAQEWTNILAYHCLFSVVVWLCVQSTSSFPPLFSSSLHEP